MSVEGSYCRAEVISFHDTVRQILADYGAKFGAERVLLIPRARVRVDDVIRRMIRTKRAGQKLGAEKINFSVDWQNLGFLVQVLPASRGVTSSDDGEGGALDPLKAED